MSTPIDRMIQSVAWTEVADPEPSPDMPHATHTGVLEIGELRLNVARLSDGRAVVTAESFAAFLDWLGAVDESELFANEETPNAR